MNETIPTETTVAERILDCFPSGNYALSGLLRLLDIVETSQVATAAVECKAEPKMMINPDFVEKQAETPEKLLMLVMHELHHILLGHTRLYPCATAVDNLVFDAVINALLCRMFPLPEHTEFFSGFYRDDEFPSCLLRPPAGWTPESAVSLPPALKKPGMLEVQDVYRALYSEAGASYSDLYRILRRNIDEEEALAVPLIGDHQKGKKPEQSKEAGSSDGNLEERSPVLFDIVREIVEKWPQPPDPIAGRSLADLLKEAACKPQRKLTKRQALRRLLQKVGGVLNGGGRRLVRKTDRMTIETPVPIWNRRSTVLSAMGFEPLLHPAVLSIERRAFGGERVHVYLDVSGSIGDLKGALYGAVLDCSDFVHPKVHLFSTSVADINLEQLRCGVCKTTGGTDIDCVAQHMREKNVRRAVIITDGYVGRPGGQNRKTLAKARLGVALTPGYSQRDDLEEVTDCWIQLTEN